MSGPSNPRLGADASRDAGLVFDADNPAWLSEVAHDLERLSVSGDVMPSGDFMDRVATAIAREPLPRPTVAAGSALRKGRPKDLLVAIVDSWRVAWSGGRPIAIRAQAAALVLVAMLALGSVSGIAAVGAWSTFGPHGVPAQLPTPMPQIGPTQSPMPSASPSPTLHPSPSLEPTASPDDSPHATRTPQPTQHATAKPTDGPDGTDDHDGGSGGDGSDGHSSGSDGSSAGPMETPSDGGGGRSDD